MKRKKILFIIGERSIMNDPIRLFLEAWQWGFGEKDRRRHPVTTGNCLHKQFHPQLRWGGDLGTGFFRNAPHVCGHCFPGTAGSMMAWSESFFVFQSKDEENSEKPGELSHHLDAMGIKYRILRKVR